ncbi:MAG: hypothetical protein KDN22_33695 [Verrucomicrobiae bacterium]|nr:hypothetical protein [Verrucomicrobiae bacterium]
MFMVSTGAEAKPGDLVAQWNVSWAGKAEFLSNVACSDDGHIWAGVDRHLFLLDSEGRLLRRIEAGSGSLQSLVTLPDGDVLVSGVYGRIRSLDGTVDFDTAQPFQMNSSGERDETFDLSWLPPYPYAVETIPLQDGRIVIGASFGGSGKIFRVFPDGKEDLSFSMFDGLGYTVDLEVDSKGRVYALRQDGVTIGNSSSSGPKLHRFLADGTPDQKFHLSGFNRDPYGRISDSAHLWAVALLSDDGLLLVGEFRNTPFVTQSNTLRFDKDGRVDSLWYRLQNGKPYSKYGTLVEADGRIILWGEDLTRLYPDGTPDPSFNVAKHGSVRDCAIDFQGRLVAVGDFGVGIFELGAGTPAPPVLVEPEASSIVQTVSTPFIFAPLIACDVEANFQWFHNGALMSGQTDRILRLTSLEVDDSGVYSIRVTDRNGVFDGRVLNLQVVPATPDSPDYTWHPEEPIPWVTGAFPTLDGGIVLWNRFEFDVLKLQADGKADPDFHVALVGQEPSRLQLLAVDPLTGEFLAVADTQIVVLESNGRQRPGFDWDWSWSDSYDRFLSWRSDGSVLIERKNWQGTQIFELTVGAPAEPAPLSMDVDERILPLDDGTLLLVSAAPSGGFELRRMSDRFDPIPAFGSVAVDVRGMGDINAVIAEDGKLILFGAIISVNQTQVENLARLLPNGMVDPTFFLNRFSDRVEAVHPNSDGGMHVVGAFQRVNGLNQVSVCRLHADGTIDVSFGPGYPLQSKGISLLRDDRLYFLPDFGARYEFIRGVESLRPFRTVGGAGASLRPKFLLQPTGEQIPKGTSVELRAVVAATPPATWQWQRNGVDIPGETAPSLCIEDANSEDTDWYRVIATNALGAAASQDVLVDVIDKPLSGQIDQSFQPPAVLSRETKRVVVAVQADGRAIVANVEWDHPRSAPIVRLNQDGQIDPEFTPDISDASALAIQHIAVQRDQRILIGLVSKSDFLWRMLPDGSRDPSFNLEPPHMDNNHYPGQAVAVQWGDRILAAIGFWSLEGVLGTPYYAYTFTGDGGDPQTMDTLVGFDFLEPPRSVPVISSSGSAFLPVGAAFPSVERVSIDIDADRMFNETLAAHVILSFDVDHKGRLLAVVGNPSIGHVRLMRFTENGELDLTFRESRWYGFISVEADVDGGLYVTGSFDIVDGEPRKGVARMLPSGYLDHRFDPGAGFDEAPAQATVTPGGDVLFSGPFSQYDGHEVRAVVRVHGVRNLPLEAMDVLISDNLAAVVNVQPDELTRSDLESIGWLDLSRLRLTSLRGLEQCRQLRGLVLDGNALSDIETLALMPPLAIISIRGVPILSIAPLLQRPPRHLIIDSEQAIRFNREIEELGNSTIVHIVEPETRATGDGLEWRSRWLVQQSSMDFYSPPTFGLRSELTWRITTAPTTSSVEYSEDLSSWITLEVSRSETDATVTAILPKDGRRTGYYRLSW